MISKQQFDEVQSILDRRSFSCSKSHTFAYTGLIRCGECGAAITAENKTKHQKNGNVHHYTNYHCTERTKKCSQKPLRVQDLEEQIMDVLSRINVPASFHRWAIKQLKVEHENEIEDQKNIVTSHRPAWDTCKQKLDALFDLRLSGDVTQEEFSAHKERLLEEKNKYEELINDANRRVETWLDFAETARKRFEHGSMDDRRDIILAALGSNLLLFNKKLRITLTKPLELVQNVAPDVQTLHKRLEPIYPIENTEFYEKSYAKNVRWGG